MVHRLAQHKIPWKKLYDEFKATYPKLAREQVVHWEPFGQMEILIILKDGTRMVYNYLQKRSRFIYVPRIEPIEKDEVQFNFKSEDECLADFSERLGLIMKDRKMSQKRLAEYTGISRQAINNYLNGKRMPSAYILGKIATVLECSIFDLTNME